MGYRDSLRKLGRRVLSLGKRQEPSSRAPASMPRAMVVPSRTVDADLWAVRHACEPTGRPRLINHWATWCDGCLEELPALVRLHERFGAQVDFVGIGWERFSSHNPDRAEQTMAQTAAEYGVLWPTCVFDGDADTLIRGLELAESVIPQTFLVDAAGRTLAFWVGPILEGEVAAALLAATASAAASVSP